MRENYHDLHCLNVCVCKLDMHMNYLKIEREHENECSLFVYLLEFFVILYHVELLP